MRKYNVAVIGLGWASSAHIAALNATDRGRVVAVHSTRRHDAAALRRRHGCEFELFHDLEAMLRSPDIDVVSICTRPELHAQQLSATARAGKHFIVEKPVALSIDETFEAVRAVRASGVRGCVCFEGRFSGQFLATRALIDSGLLGTIHYGEFDYFHGIGPWYNQYRWNTRKASGGSSLLSAGCHALSSLLLCMGNDVESVTSHATRSRSDAFAAYEYPTTSVTIVNFRDGRVGKVASVIDCLQPYYRHTHLVGSEGTLLDNRFHSRRLPGLDAQRWSELAFPLIHSGDVRDHPYKPQFDAFFTALDRDEDMPLTSFQEALLTHRIVFAADRSAEERRTVRLDEIPDFWQAADPGAPAEFAALADGSGQVVNGRAVAMKGTIER